MKDRTKKNKHHEILIFRYFLQINSYEEIAKSVIPSFNLIGRIHCSL
jgi:hypothetical protein